MDQSENLFKIGQITNACSVSRATLLRLEEDGLITPARKDPDSGYRYYSLENLFHIRRVLYLRSLGFSTAVIRHHLETPTDPTPLISDMEERVRQMTKTLWVLRQFTKDSSDFSVSIMEVGDRNCYVNNVVTTGSFRNVASHVRATIIEAVSNGVHIDRDRGILIATDRTDIVHGKFDEEIPYLYSIGVPTKDPVGGKIVSISAGEVMSFLWDGDVRSLPEKGEMLYSEAYLQHRLPVGPFGFEIVLPMLSSDVITGDSLMGHLLIRAGFAVMKLEDG